MRDIDATDWSGLGFYKSCTFKYIKVDDKGKITCNEYDFFAHDPEIVCGQCGQSKYTYLKPERTGVYRSCVYCSTTDGPISKNFGTLRKSYQINTEEAISILEGRNAPKREIMRFKKPKRRVSPLQKMKQSRERPEVSQ